mmetsp:Transcript_33232/g.87394  ORF Transcript_33232/g.87394 Transcript_33232/m.87394 type:complete len:302 (+) Transcript_33232:455-1360(+)
MLAAAAHSLLLLVEERLVERDLVLGGEREHLGKLAARLGRVAAIPPLDELSLGDLAVSVGVDLVELVLEVGLVAEREPELDRRLVELLLVDVARLVRVDREKGLVQVCERRGRERGVALVSNRAAELADVLGRHLHLGVAFFLAPFEVGRHQVSHARDRLLGRLRVNEGEAHARGKHVLHGERHLVLARVLHLGLEVRVVGDEQAADMVAAIGRHSKLGRRARRRLRELAHTKRGGAVRVAEVLRDCLGHAIFLHELHMEQVVEALATEELDLARRAWLRMRKLLVRDDLIHQLLRHRTVR